MRKLASCLVAVVILLVPAWSFCSQTPISRTVEGFVLGMEEDAALDLIKRRAAKGEVKSFAEVKEFGLVVHKAGKVFKMFQAGVPLHSTEFQTDSAKVRLRFYGGKLYSIELTPVTLPTVLFKALIEKYGQPEPGSIQGVSTKHLWTDGKTRLGLLPPYSVDNRYVIYEDIAAVTERNKEIEEAQKRSEKTLPRGY